MHIVFLNPQGNFDAADSHLTEHPDFGGQLVYVKELAMAMAERGHMVDIVTRKIDDPAWPEFSSEIAHYPGYERNPRIVRIGCGGPLFLNKEHLWDHMPEFIDRLLAFYGDQLPQFATAHYADGGYCAALLKAGTGIGFTFTGHSLGAQKLDKLGTNSMNFPEMDRRYLFSKRIAAERLAMHRTFRIITSTTQERREQYAHPLYHGAIDADAQDKFAVVPPGVNLRVFSTRAGPQDDTIGGQLDARLENRSGPWIMVSSRLDEKKNIIGLVRAYAGTEALRQRAGLAICIRGITDPFTEIDTLSSSEQEVLRPILQAITTAGIRDRVAFLNIQSQQELAATYRYFARQGSVFALTAFYEPFGLAPIEAAACGLACVATANGGPSEIFAGGSGVLVDPFDNADIARGLQEGLDNFETLSERARQRVDSTYTWEKTAEGYMAVIAQGLDESHARNEAISRLDATKRIREYLAKK